MQNKVSHWASGDEAISFDTVYIRQELDSTHIILITIIYLYTQLLNLLHFTVQHAKAA